MQQSTNYNFNLPEGTDLVNLLTQLIPNWASLDSILRGVQNDTFETATETVALGVHALTRLDPNAKLIKWIATANYTAGETFTVDGTPIAASTPSGNTLATGAYVSGAIVIAAINSDETAMTVFVTGTNVASDSERLGGELPSYYATDQDMDTAKQNIEDLDNLMGNTSISAIGDGTVTGAISSFETKLSNTETLWTKVGTVTADNTFNLSSYLAGKKEVKAVCVDSVNGRYEEFTWTLADVLPNKNNDSNHGYYLPGNPSYWASAIVFLTNGTTFKINLWTDYAASNVNNVTTSLYVR